MVRELETARQGFIEIVGSFPVEKREEILLDRWSLKNLIAHLSGWDLHQIEALENHKAGKQSKLPDNLKASINSDFVVQRSKWGWGKVYQEFIKVSQDLVNSYEALPEHLWDKLLFEDGKMTPRKFIKIEINHLNNTHGPQIKAILRNISG